ncbi:MAG: precorrin-3B C(17)-methyltransferase [Dehalococcoidia bacterium]|nr:precorrin-3B C(17)-methyltransferase [Dehalococcoidia bacterium]
MSSGRLDKIAIVAITKKGVKLGRRLSLLFPGSHLYVPAKFAAKSGEYAFPPPARKVVKEAFSRYRYLVMAMAVGAAVRLLASELGDKRQDPGVVAIDDSANFVVSLLSGHLGGANELTRRIASLLGAQPVITTASDVSQTIAVDLLGKEFGWELEDDGNVTRVSASLVNGECVGIYQDAGETNWWAREKSLPANLRLFAALETLKESGCQAAVVITDRVLTEEYQALPPYILVYRPKSLVIGIGCNRGTKSAEIEKAVASVLLEHRLSIKSLRNVATIDRKKEEVGLLEFARKYNLPIEYFDKETLEQANFPSSLSAALKYLGTPSVCEAAAILSSGNTSLLVPKLSYDRKVAIAVARLPFVSSDKPKTGKLFLVGIGPGHPEHMTLRARDVIRLSEVIVGYTTYIRLIEPFLSRKEVIATGMGEEVQRAKVATSLVKEGKTVAIVCGGDAGIYGMAGLVGEILHEQGDRLDVEVVPGVPSLVATAALLGAPAMGDFVTISLSDYLVPWADIRQKLELVARGDFVIVIHNPRSQKRQHHLIEAREIILQHRPSTTPVGIVSNAYRQKQQVAITDLEHMLDFEIGMNTTIIIGNSSTFAFDGWMVTPRGYQRKYDLASGASR